MAGPEIIDIHLHLTRDPQQEKLVFPKKDWPDEWYWANLTNIIPYMDARGISHVATMNIMITNAMIEARVSRARAAGANDEEIAKARVDLIEEMRERVRRFNTEMCEASRREPRIITYVMIHPVLFGETAVEELERCIALGAKGIKVHPSNAVHLPDHPNMMPVYELCQSAGLGVLTDSTSRQHADGTAYGSPLHWRPVLKAFPHLKFIMAHLSDDMWDDRLDLAAEFKDNLWFDMSGGLVDSHHPAGGHAMMPLAQAPRVFRKVGVDRIMFGSDGPPVGDIFAAAQQVMELDMTIEEKEKILAKNARQFLGLTK